MAATIYNTAETTDTEFGLVDETFMIVTGISSQYNVKESVIMNAEGDPVTVSFSGKTADIKFDGYTNGSTDMEICNVLTTINTVSKFGFTAGTILIKSISESSAQGEFKKISVSATAYESVMTLRA